MDKKEADIKTDMEAAFDRGESTAFMEPLQISQGSRHRAALTELSVELAAKSAGFRRSLPEGIVYALSELTFPPSYYHVLDETLPL